MTFEEALKQKEELPREIMYNHVKMKIYIVPLNQADFTRFMSFFYTHRINDKTAMAFSSDNQFTLHGLSRNQTYNFFLQLKDILKVSKNV